MKKTKKRMQFFKNFLIGLSPLLVATPIIATSCVNQSSNYDVNYVDESKNFKSNPNASITSEIPFNNERDLTYQDVYHMIDDQFKNRDDFIDKKVKQQQELHRLNIDLQSNTKYQLNPQYDITKSPNYKMLDLLNKDPNNLSKEEFWYLVFHKFNGFDNFIQQYNELVFFNYEGGLNSDYKKLTTEPVITNDVQKKDEMLELHNLMNEVYNESQKDQPYSKEDKELNVSKDLQQKVLKWLKDHHYLQNQIEDFTNIFKNIKFRIVSNKHLGKLIEIEVETDVFYKGRNLNEIYEIYEKEKYPELKDEDFNKETVIKSRSYTWKLPVRALIDTINNQSFTPTYENVIHVLSTYDATSKRTNKFDQEEYNNSVVKYQNQYSLTSLSSQYEDDLVKIYGNNKFGFSKTLREKISKNEKFINHKSKLQIKEEKQKELEKEREDY